ncbi:MAG: hypothetical protein AB7O32_16380 [Vicinamibacterales bacterium]
MASLGARETRDSGRLLRRERAFGVVVAAGRDPRGFTAAGSGVDGPGTPFVTLDADGGTGAGSGAAVPAASPTEAVGALAALAALAGTACFVAR